MIRLALPAVALAFAASVALAQPATTLPQPKQQGPLPITGGSNLRILPQDIPQRRLINIMQAFNAALGVQCSHCHVPGDFASDENPRKVTARGMMRMTARINAELLPQVGGLARPVVNCTTCHRGSPHPDSALLPRQSPPGAAPQQ